MNSWDKTSVQEPTDLAITPVVIIAALQCKFVFSVTVCLCLTVLCCKTAAGLRGGMSL